MELIRFCLTEAVSNLHRDRARLLPMALGILWGTATIVVLLAVANGFESSQRRALAAYGDRFILLRLNRAELDRAASGREPRLTMDTLDIERLREGAPSIRHLSPMNMAYRARITARHGAGAGVSIAGALPEIASLRNIPLAEGRFYNEIDEEQRNRVIVLGPVARKQLFGSRPAVGETVRISGFSTSSIPARESPRDLQASSRRGASSPAPTPGPQPPATTGPVDSRIQGELFEVIGVLADVEIQEESYVSVKRSAFIPYATSTAVFTTDYNTIFIEPRSAADRDLAVRQFTAVMSARYGFAPDDENAVLVYFDSIERARSITRVFGFIRLFLTLAGGGILAVGAVGVMNVVLVSIAARKFEIGLCKALGATPRLIRLQFFTETVLGCLASGAVGCLLGFGAIALLGRVPLPEGVSRPVPDPATAAWALGLLVVIATAAGSYPAWRASRLPPVEALRQRN